MASRGKAKLCNSQQIYSPKTLSEPINRGLIKYLSPISVNISDDAARGSNDGQEHVEEGPKEEWLPGVVYQHWGRTSCSGDASLVYNGKRKGKCYKRLKTFRSGNVSYNYLYKF